MILRLSLIILSIGSFSLPCMAGLALRSKAFTPACKTQARKEWKIDKRMMATKDTPSITSDDVAEIIPMDLQTTNDGTAVANKILQRSANALLKSSIIKNSFLMKTASKVQKATKVDMAVKQKDSSIANKEIEHKVKFDVQALKGQAKLVYSGWIDSKMEYQATNNTFQASLEEKLSDTSKIALTYSSDNRETQQLLKYQLSW